MSKLISIQDIINWCDKQVEEGKQITLKWEGGGDSGWVYFEVDGEQEDGEEIEALVSMMYNQLDYGSWAGEYSANGEANYNKDTKCFDGIDYYSEDRWDALNFENAFSFPIPAAYGFDSIEYYIDGNLQDEEHVNVEISFNITNGFITPELREIETEITQNIEEAVKKEFENKSDVNYINTHNIILRNDMMLENNVLTLKIPVIDYSTYDTTENHVTIDLVERLENEKENE